MGSLKVLAAMAILMWISFGIGLSNRIVNEYSWYIRPWITLGGAAFGVPLYLSHLGQTVQ